MTSGQGPFVVGGDLGSLTHIADLGRPRASHQNACEVQKSAGIGIDMSTAVHAHSHGRPNSRTEHPQHRTQLGGQESRNNGTGGVH